MVEHKYYIKMMLIKQKGHYSIFGEDPVKHAFYFQA